MTQHEDKNHNPILGKQMSELKTTFLYKVNVAVAVLLLYLNIQSLVGFVIDGATPAQLITNIALVSLSLAYGLLAINGYVHKILLHERGIIIKSLFSVREMGEDDIAYVTFRRVNLRKMLIYITLKSGKFITLSTAKYENHNMPMLVEYLVRFKKEEGK